MSISSGRFLECEGLPLDGVHVLGILVCLCMLGSEFEDLIMIYWKSVFL